MIQLYQLDFGRAIDKDWLCNGRELVAITKTEEAARNTSQVAQELLSHTNKELIPLTM